MYLRSAVKSQHTWPIRKRFDAFCHRSAQPYWKEKGKYLPEDVPHSPCSCGIYALKATSLGFIQLSAAYSRYRMMDLIRPVVGVVALWGRVREHQRGYRAQYGYPAAFLKDRYNYVEQLAQKYGAVLLDSTPDVAGWKKELTKAVGVAQTSVKGGS